MSIAQAETLKILSWNLYLVPWPIHRTLQDERTEAIASQLLISNYDVIFFQELFLEKHKDILWEKLKSKFPNESARFKGRGLHFVGSGLWAISKYPMKVIDHTYFSDCSGSDCLASKAAVMMEIQLPNRIIQVINTHLQAWSGEENNKVRRSQLSQIKKMMEKNKVEHSIQIAVGDFNIRHNDLPHYKDLIQTLGLQNAPPIGPLKYSIGGDNSWRSDGREDEKLDKILDYILTQESPKMSVERSMVRRTSRLDNKLVDLSDHFGIEATFNWP